jgi:kinetochore protein Mis13/DSN1
MTAIVTRTPLHTLSMTGAQANGTTKRKSLRQHTDPEEDAPPTKKTKASTVLASKNASQSTLKTTRSRKGELAPATPLDAQLLIRARPVYNLADDDFQYSKRKAPAPAVVAAREPETTAGAAAPAPEVQPVQEQPPLADDTTRSRKKPRKTLPTTPEHATSRRRSKRLSGNSPVAATSKPASASQPNPATPPAASSNQENVAPAAEHSPAVDQGELTIHKKRGPAKIPLPFGETPVLRRNKEMRKLSAERSRRSSSGMRGRRASSLIDTGNSLGTLIFSFPLGPLIKDMIMLLVFRFRLGLCFIP